MTLPCSLALVLCFAIAAPAAVTGGAEKGPSVIPIPVRVTPAPGAFELTRGTRIAVESSDPRAREVAEYLARFLQGPTGYPLPIVTEGKKGDIRLAIRQAKAGSESYRLDVSQTSVTITAPSAAGLFYGVQTLRQLLPVEVERRSLQSPGRPWRVQACSIQDAPRFGYRGMHLDVGRHFFPADSVKKYIDILAMHKMNRFHWHLTEDQGWRIEIPKYPLLTSVSAWRKAPGGERYGGFYTQEEIRDVVRYARERFVEIVPEIELPGHALAALAAYPELSCTGGPFTVGTRWGIYDDVYCAGRDETFRFLEDVLSDVVALFPGQYIHIGGDEVPKTRWKACERCQRRIASEGLKNEAELQSYFIRRIEAFLTGKGRKLIGWDEILEGGLAPAATVMSWRGTEGGIAAARQGHDAIMTPTSHCYFDYYQGSPQVEPYAIGGLIPIRKVYAYEPIPPELNEAEAKHILGAQGNLWTEYIETFPHLQYMALPRLCALAEVVWSPASQRSWPRFAERLGGHFARMESAGIAFARSMFLVNAKPVLDPARPSLAVALETEYPGTTIRYTLDDTDPGNGSPQYRDPIRIDSSTILRAAAAVGESPMNPSSTFSYSFGLATGKTVTLTTPPGKAYTAGGAYGLVDAVQGSRNLGDGAWQGFEGTDLEAVIDLGDTHAIRSVAATFLQNTVSWVFLPTVVQIMISRDGTAYTTVAEIRNDAPQETTEPFIKSIGASMPPTPARFIKVRARNVGECPAWHQGAGGKAWLFVDEIQVH